MYDTTLGTRVLYGAEAQVIAGAAWSLTDELRSMVPNPGEQPYDHVIGISVLESLTAAQVIVLIDRVTAYLLDPQIEAPTRTAVLDATIAALFQQVATEVQMEIGLELDSTEPEDDDTSVRATVAAASDQISDPQSLSLDTPDPECVVMETWQYVIDRLYDRVLMDTDWQLESVALDLDPQQGSEMKGSMGIDDDYFIDVVPDASVDDAVAAWCNMMQRITGWVPEKWRFGGGVPRPADADLPPKIEVLSFLENQRFQPSPPDETLPDFQQLKPVLLSAVMCQLDTVSEEWMSFVDRINGEVVGCPSEVIEAVENGDDSDKYCDNIGKEYLEIAKKICGTDDFLSLPSQFDIHEWKIMRDFCAMVESESDRQELLEAVHGNGAFRHFNSTVYRLGLDTEWLGYKDVVIERIVIDWLESSSIQWSRTKPGEPPF